MSCPCCKKEMAISVQEMREPNAPRRQGSAGEGVPIKMGLNKIGSFEATVTRKTAGALAHTFLGGLLVLMTFIACIVFGVKPPKRG